MTNAQSFTEGQPVTVDAYDGPLAGTYLGTGTTVNAFAPNGQHLRIRVEETAQGYEKGEIINALPVRVTARPEAAAATATVNETPEQVSARLGRSIEWAREHTGDHKCVDGRRYVVSCLVSDPTCDKVARSYLSLARR